jgi:hypothetical protein
VYSSGRSRKHSQSRILDDTVGQGKYFHFTTATGKWRDEPELFLELLRFNEMLLWSTQVVQRLLEADQHAGIKRQAYQRLVAQKY